MNIDQILEARELRVNKVSMHLTYHGVIVIKANVPGENKNLSISYLLVNIFKNEVISKIRSINSYFYESADGPYFLILTKKCKSLKKDLVLLEESHPLGRYIDLDFFIDNPVSISRSEVGFNKRNCVMCNDDVIKCMRSNKHTSAEIIQKINEDIRSYLGKWVDDAVKFSVFAELDLEDKFGLVTPTSSGSHPDMDYEVMKKAYEVLRPYFNKMFFCGYDEDDLNLAFKRAQSLGIEAENAMFDNLMGVNAYKGLIFILGLMLVSTGYSLSHNEVSKIFDNIAYMASDIFERIETKTFGSYAYSKYNFGGARKEAHSGLRSVEKAVNILSDFSTLSLRKTLGFLVGISDDSVLLKRSKGFEKYNYFKEKISTCNQEDEEAFKKLTYECIENNISCGGSADLLITTVYLRQFINSFK